VAEALRVEAAPTTSQADAVISARSVSHFFGTPGEAHFVQSLADTSLDIRQGELVGLIGPSGCGKTTLLNMIGGLIGPKSGVVEVEGQRVTGPLPKKIAFVFQEHSLFPWNTILDNIRIALKFQGVDNAEGNARAREALEAVGLWEFANHYPGQLSGGMKQRAALARALSLKTDIILMDEPFAALDEQTRMILGEDLSVLLAQTGKTIVFVTHSLGEAVFLSDRVAVFSARPGRIKTVINIEEAHPRHPEFATSEKFNRLRTELYSLLHDEIRKSVADSLHTRRAGGGAAGGH
jgi:NitT/TauT family transport system ATP-binding protein